MALSNEFNWTSDICPHHVYNFINITEKSKMEGRQSRFLGLILGMDPISMLRASGQIAKPFDNGHHYDHIQYWGETRELNRYRAVVNVTNVVEMFAFLSVLKIIWKQGDIPCLYQGQPVDEDEFHDFVEKIKKRHGRKMKNTRSAAGIAMVKEEEETDDNIAGLTENQPTSPPSDAYLKRYLMKNWYKFRKIGREIMKNGWHFPETWKSYQEFKKELEFSDRILSMVKLTQLKRSRYCTRCRP